jgi:glycosyltransferase involved in cell wall biosynthesis
MKTVAVCMLTYKRPALMNRALLSLLDQEIDSATSYTIIVIDNDKEGSARGAVRRIAAACPTKVLYAVEPRLGIARARNCALELRKGFDFVAFLDDDEFAPPTWLNSLLSVQANTQADVVCGPVVPVYSSAPQWIIRGGFFSPRIRETGSPVRFVASGNVLIEGKCASTYSFDLRFDATGGEDTHFFERLHMSGAKMVWAAEAMVYENYPAGRMNAEWIVDRARSSANRFTRAYVYLNPGTLAYVVRVMKGAGSMVCGVVMMPFGVLGKHYRIKSLMMIGRGMGTFSALRNRSHHYYSSAPIDDESAAENQPEVRI